MQRPGEGGGLESWFCDCGVICEASVSESDSTTLIRGSPSLGGGKTRLDYAMGCAEICSGVPPPSRWNVQVGLECVMKHVVAERSYSTPNCRIATILLLGLGKISVLVQKPTSEMPFCLA
ncbi:hypothetical protein CDAR_621281 [Caerostris darwini]|uniref:Uncharacterized protein n=1 Tax=Caerostris darwini TaxID=1538125 RepID=A0AAV4RLP4_9ARAC|nr:hypothetical protein CDAR_621281 [Caerostris darwini]